MKLTQEEFKKSLKNIATHLELPGFVHLIETPGGFNLPQMTKDIIYQMYVKQLNSYFVKDDVLFRDMMNVKDYCQELDKIGWIDFK